jgi:tetratricopeptide (TPR) repeat protein
MVVGFSLVTWQWQRTRMQHTRAQQYFHQAHQAVQEMHALVYNEDQYDAADFQPLRKEVVALALKYYQQFQTQELTDPTLIADLAGAYRDIGFIAHGSGSQTDALQLYRKSLELWQQLTRLRPEQREHWYFLASVKTLIAQVLVRDHRYAEAIPLLEGALDVHQRMGHQETAPGAVANTLEVLTEVYKSLDRAADALQAARQVVTQREAIASAEPRNVHHLRELAGSYTFFGSVHLRFDHPKEATRWCERARMMQEELASQVPEVPIC